MNNLINKVSIKIFLLFFIVILFSNVLSVFYFSELIGDDELWYSRVIAGMFIPSARSILGFYLEWPMWNMMVWNANFTHFFYILFFMAPLSFFSYYLYRKYFGLLPVAAFIAAVLPHVLPSMYLLPAYTNGSYMMYLLLIGILGVLSGLRFLERGDFIYFLTSVALYVVLSLTSEFSAMLSLPYILVFVICFGLNKKAIYLSLCYFAVGIYTAIRMLNIGSAGTSINLYDLSEIFIRFKDGFSFLLPFPYPKDWFYSVFSLTFFISLFAFFLNIKSEDVGLFYSDRRVVVPDNNRKYIVVIYAFSIIWLLSVSLFTFVSHWFGARYFYLAAFPFSLLIVFTIMPFFRCFSSSNKKTMVVISSAFIIALGLWRNINYYENQKSAKEVGDVYYKEFQEINLPTGSQLFIMDNKRHHKGIWQYNTGYIQYHSKRPDLSGHIGDDLFNYDNPFVGKRSWGGATFLRAIKYQEPFFVFKVNRENNVFEQYQYILKWDEPIKSSPWSIIELNQVDGGMTLLETGDGWGEYIDAIESLSNRGINPESIALGGYPTQNTIKNLKLTETDLSLLRTLLN